MPMPGEQQPDVFMSEVMRRLMAKEVADKEEPAKGYSPIRPIRPTLDEETLLSVVRSMSQSRRDELVELLGMPRRSPYLYLPEQGPSHTFDPCVPHSSPIYSPPKC